MNGLERVELFSWLGIEGDYGGLSSFGIGQVIGLFVQESCGKGVFSLGKEVANVL